MITIKAFQVADSIDIKRFRNEYTGKLYSYSSSELFYQNEDQSYLYVMAYGVAVFSGYDELKISEHIEFLKGFCRLPLEEKISEGFTIHERADEDKFEHNEVYVSKYSADVLKIVMLNVGQSVVLDYYQSLATQMLEETTFYTEKLEREGRLSINSKPLLQFIGKTLNVKNNIFDQLYILDQPEETWEDEYLSKIDAGIRHIFDIKSRFKNVDYHLQIIKENLDLFKDLMQHKRSNLLEIIIIALILVEVVDLFLEKLM